MENYGTVSLIPLIIVIIMALVTKHTSVSLITGSIVGTWILFGFNFWNSWIDIIFNVLASELWIWLMLVCGFFGSLISLFKVSGGIAAFNSFVAKVCKTKRHTLFMTWLLGVIIFIDDWLCIVTVGAAMRQSTDKYGIPRENLAFISNLTASSICSLVPVSTWGIFMASQLMAVGLASATDSILVFIKTLPYMFYPIIALLWGLLYSIRKQNPPVVLETSNSDNISSDTDKSISLSSKNAFIYSILKFILPVICVNLVAAATGEMLYGVLSGLVVCALMYTWKKQMPFSEYWDALLSGFSDMLGVLFVIANAFVLKEINTLLGMPEFVINAIGGSLSPEILPVTAFLLIALLGSAAGNFWGICAISLPVIVPIAQQLGGNTLLVTGAVFSATVLSSHICFYGAEAMLACHSAEISPVSYLRTALPRLVIPVLFSILSYIVVGYV